MGKILGYTRRSGSLADKAARNPGLIVAKAARLPEEKAARPEGKAARDVTPMGALPENFTSSQWNQLALAMFHRANPQIPWFPADYGANGSREIDGIFGTRSLEAARSYIDYRFGPGLVAVLPGEPGIPSADIREELGAALKADTPYVDDPAIASVYYEAIMKGTSDSLPLLSQATPGRRSLTSKRDAGLLASHDFMRRSEVAPTEGGMSFWMLIGVAGLAAAATLYFMPKRGRR